MDITITIPPQLVPQVEHAARRRGHDLTTYVQELVASDVSAPLPAAPPVTGTTPQHAAALALVDELYGVIKGVDRETLRWLAEDEELCGY